MTPQPSSPSTKAPTRSINCTDIEIAVANGFDYRRNLIVPNVWWGLGFRHEIDVLVLTPNNYAYEIEIKVSGPDLRRDIDKIHNHTSNMLRKQFFAVTPKLEALAMALILKHRPSWGLIVVDDEGGMRTPRQAGINKNAWTFSAAQRKHLYELASMRTWSLKKALAKKRTADTNCVATAM